MKSYLYKQVLLMGFGAILGTSIAALVLGTTETLWDKIYGIILMTAWISYYFRNVKL